LHVSSAQARARRLVPHWPFASTLRFHIFLCFAFVGRAADRKLPLNLFVVIAAPLNLFVVCCAEQAFPCRVAGLVMRCHVLRFDGGDFRQIS
jgi:hypothetical protein